MKLKTYVQPGDLVERMKSARQRIVATADFAKMCPQHISSDVGVVLAVADNGDCYILFSTHTSWINFSVLYVLRSQVFTGTELLALSLIAM